MFVRSLNYDIIKVAKALSQSQDFFWLDSAGGGDFSIMAWAPRRKIIFDTVVQKPAFVDFLKSISPLSRPSATHQEGRGEFANKKFTGGWIGYLSYESYVFSELIPIKPRHFKNYPLAVFCYYDTFIDIDHKTNLMEFVSLSDDAEKKFKELTSLLCLPPSAPKGENQGEGYALPQLTVTPTRYAADFQKIKTALQDGDFFELNYTAEYAGKLDVDPLDLYLQLRQTAPAPMMAYAGFPELKILSASPECFFKIEGGEISTFPIKGTIARGKNPEEDAANKARLAVSAKDHAELLMVTDMLRSDLGRICITGSVQLATEAAVTSFTHYHHLASEISGRLPPNTNLYDIFQALFPGGSITGAPKIKVIERIDALENRARGIYTGAIGIISNNGFVEFNIPIRTLTVSGDALEFATGGGIVADSRLTDEYAECELKASGILEAISLVSKVRV